MTQANSLVQFGAFTSESEATGQDSSQAAGELASGTLPPGFLQGDSTAGATTAQNDLAAVFGGSYGGNNMATSNHHGATGSANSGSKLGTTTGNLDQWPNLKDFGALQNTANDMAGTSALTSQQEGGNANIRQSLSYTSAQSSGLAWTAFNGQLSGMSGAGSNGALGFTAQTQQQLQDNGSASLAGSSFIGSSQQGGHGFGSFESTSSTYLVRAPRMP
jgi:hypothetical protein